MVKTGQYISEHIEVFKTLVRIGAVSTSYLNYFRIYCYYASLSHIKSKMDRYEFTAESMNTNTSTVMNAVKAMERRVKP